MQMHGQTILKTQSEENRIYCHNCLMTTNCVCAGVCLCFCARVLWEDGKVL